MLLGTPGVVTTILDNRLWYSVVIAFVGSIAVPAPMRKRMCAMQPEIRRHFQSLAKVPD